MPNKSTIGRRGPITGEKLVMGLSENRDPVFQAEVPGGQCVELQLGQKLTITNIPENLRHMLDLDIKEEVIFVPSDHDAVEDQFMIARSGALVFIYDFPFADEDALTKIVVNEMLDEKSMDTFIAVLYGHAPRLFGQVSETASIN